jgi:biopolymer transport protein ExbD
MSDPGTLRFDLPRGRRRALLSLAPLIDVTFILLIFFMLVTQFDRFAPLQLALGQKRDAPLQPLRQQGSAAGALTLEIRADGALRLDGQDAITIEALPAILTERMAGNAEPLIAIDPELQVPLQQLLDVLNVIQKIPSLKSQIIVPRMPAHGDQP